jgi:hypothetical protein
MRWDGYRTDGINEFFINGGWNVQFGCMDADISVMVEQSWRYGAGGVNWTATGYGPVNQTGVSIEAVHLYISNITVSFLAMSSNFRRERGGDGGVLHTSGLNFRTQRL